MKFIVAIIMALVLFISVCHAHRDSGIRLKADGTLEGLPSEFGPASLQINFMPKSKSGQSIKLITLTLGKNKVRLPECMLSLLRTKSKNNIRVSASWYHDEKLLPHYLNVHFFDPGFDQSRSFNPKFTLLFNLRNAKLIEMEELIVLSESSANHKTIDVTSLCSSDTILDFMDKKIN